MLDFRLQNPGPQAALLVESGPETGKVIRLYPPALAERVSALWTEYQAEREEPRTAEAKPKGKK